MNNLKEKFKNQSLEELQESFSLACNNGTLNEVKYLLSLPEISEKLDIKEGLISACYWNCLNVVKYFINTYEHSDSRIINGAEEGFYFACENGRLDVVQYISTITELKENLNLYSAFTLAGHKKHLDVIHYLIFNLEIKKDHQLKNYLREEPNEQIESWFNLRTVNKKLNKSLSKMKTVESKKVKL